jgi:hypothetical protein
MVTESRKTALPVRTLAVWLAILAVGVALLYFRFDWSVDGGTLAKPAFVLSSYLFIIMLPTVYYLSLRLLHYRRVAVGLAVVTFCIFTLPYNLLGLNSLYYYATRPQYLPSIAFPSRLEFLPGGTLATFPLYWLFMPLLFLFGAACVWLVRWARARAGFHAERRLAWMLTVAFALICAQAFLHSGMRAPYTYLSYFQEPKAAQHWYYVAHFSNGSGQVEGDQRSYTSVEDAFEAHTESGDNSLMRRPFAFYLESQFGYFFNDFYCWLALNCLFWLAAVFAVARLVTRLANPRAGLIAGALTLFGPGFIAFVATSSMYMQNYATAAIAVCAFEDLIVSPADRGPRQYALFAGLLALCALVYDLEPLFVVLLAYGIARRVPWRPLLVTLVTALVLDLGFAQVVSRGLHFPTSPDNSEQVGQSLRALGHLLFHPHLSTWADTFITVIPKFTQMWLQAYFIIPALLALIGWRLLRDRPQRILVGGMLLMSFLMVFLFYLGHTAIATTPRIIYPYFIGVYLAAALALDSGSRRLFTALSSLRVAGVAVDTRIPAYARLLMPWVVVAVMALLVNIDAFGHPTQYVEFFVNTPPKFLP